jgi:hypothetical protein
MLVYLTHPDHGTHICYTLYEVEQCEKNGWKRIEQKPVEVPVEEKPKRGRPKKVKDDFDIRRIEGGGS